MSGSMARKAALGVALALAAALCGCRREQPAQEQPPEQAAPTGKIKVAMLEGIRGVDNAEARKQGFLKAMSEHEAEIEVAAMDTANWMLEQGEQVCANMLTAHPDIKGIFCANDMMALGAIKAIEAAGKAGEVVVCAYDNIKAAQEALLAGTLAATIEQHPYFMGNFGVAAAIMTLEGGDVPQEIEVPVELITKEVLLKQREEFSDAEDVTLAVERAAVGEARKKALGEVPEPSRRYRIGLIMKTLSNPFFTMMQRGAEDAAAEFGVELIVQSAEKETDFDQQADIVRSMVAQGVDAILIAPADSKALVGPLLEANSAGIPVLNLDNRLDPDTVRERGLELVTFIGPDNVQGAYLSSKYMAEQLVGGTEQEES